MIAKYICASLLTVLRITGAPAPGRIDLTRRACTTTNTKTAISRGMGGFNLGGGGLGRGAKCLPKAKEMDTRAVTWASPALGTHK